jgi:tetratricopeptide (TPR) repeat protein
MSTYLDGESSDEEVLKKNSMTESEINEISKTCTELKALGNGFFSNNQFEEALEKYSEALNLQKNNGIPKDSLVLLNRSATYLALKKYVPALNDANQGEFSSILLLKKLINKILSAVEIDPLNWKGHWRKGVSLMAMSKRLFRTKQALEAFQKCSECESLPANKRSEVAAELEKANRRLQQQESEVIYCFSI